MEQGPGDQKWAVRLVTFVTQPHQHSKTKFMNSSANIMSRHGGMDPRVGKCRRLRHETAIVSRLVSSIEKYVEREQNKARWARKMRRLFGLVGIEGEI